MKNNYKRKIILFISIIIVLILILALIASFMKPKNNNQNLSINTTNNIVKSINEFNSVKEIIEFASSKYIDEVNTDEQGYNYKFNVEFRYKLYENNESMEKYFLSIINKISYLYKYKANYILSDEKNNINIKVICNGKNIEKILINNEENYYIKHGNSISNNNLKKDIFTELVGNSNELKNTISDKWNYEENNYGTKDSEFNNYNLFWDEGIRVKVSHNIVKNIIFNSNYEGKVINNLKVSDDFDKIIDTLGTPTFGDKDANVIGYKNELMYVFFTKNQNMENEISIYQNIETLEEIEFEQLLKQFFDSEISIKKFMNELTYLWPDYESYEYSSSFLKITYPDKGVKIEYGNGTMNEIAFYENYEYTDYSKKISTDGMIKANYDKSLYEEIENNRINQEIEIYIESNYMYSPEDTEYTTSNLYAFTYKYNSNNEIKKVFFINKDKKYPNKELREDIFTGFFINDEYFVYSIKEKGIYLYNVLTDEKIIVLEGKQEFNLLKYKDNILYYDEESIVIEEEE